MEHFFCDEPYIQISYLKKKLNILSSYSLVQVSGRKHLARVQQIYNDRSKKDGFIQQQLDTYLYFKS